MDYDMKEYFDKISERLYDIAGANVSEEMPLDNLKHLIETDPLLYNYMLTRAAFDNNRHRTHVNNMVMIQTMFLDGLRKLSEYNIAIIERLEKYEVIENELKKKHHFNLLHVVVIIMLLFFLMFVVHPPAATAVLELFKHLMRILPLTFST